MLFLIAEEKLRKISVTKSPLDGGAVEITTVTELTSPTKEKMNIIVKERASSIEGIVESSLSHRVATPGV